ncbi:hypothetical protein [Corynebacterium sp.]|uniref:hypothetical protein n=1 Tax=Corynebacterium sp. TaxID=1720 RepID=UPI003736FD40
MPKFGDIAITDIISVVVAIGSLVFALVTALPEDTSSNGSSSMATTLPADVPVPEK